MVKEESLANVVDVIVKAKMGVKPDSQISHRRREGKVVVKKGEEEMREEWSWLGVPVGMASVFELLSCKKFSLIHAPFQAGVQLSVRGGRRGGGSDLEVELCVAGIATELCSMPANDTTEGKHVDGEKSWTKRALGDFRCYSEGAGLSVCQDQDLGLSGEV